MKCGVIVDAEHNVIDGHARRDICEELGIDWMVGADVRAKNAKGKPLTENDKLTLAITLNLTRRSTAPTRKQRLQYVEILLQSDPPQSDACIAGVVGVSRSLVQQVKSRLAKSGKLKNRLKTVDRNGKVRTVSSDKRKKSQEVRFFVKSEREYNRIAPAAHELKHIPTIGGFVRSPGLLSKRLKRQETLDEIRKSDPPAVSGIDIRHCDFRKLEIDAGTVDLICTDVVWSATAAQDWEDLGVLAAKWLKPTGRFVTLIGQMHLDKLIAAVSKSMKYSWTFCSRFKNGTTNFNRMCNVSEAWRPAPVFFQNGQRVDFQRVKDVIESDGPEKDFHDWQQCLNVVRDLVRFNLPKEGRFLVCDPCLGSGTTAVSCAQLGHSFIGCDIDPEAVKIAKHRVATEGKPSNDRKQAS